MDTTTIDIARLTKAAADLEAKFPLTRAFVLKDEGKIFKKNRSDGTFEILDLETAEFRIKYFNIGSPHARAR